MFLNREQSLVQKWCGWPLHKCRHKITFSISVLLLLLLFLAVLDLNDQDNQGGKMPLSCQHLES